MLKYNYALPLFGSAKSSAQNHQNIEKEEPCANSNKQHKGNKIRERLKAEPSF